MGTPLAGWVVCRGETRSIDDAKVVCPLRGPVTVAECLGCRLLVTSSAERGRGGWCAADPDAGVAVSAAHGQDQRSAAGLR